MELCREISSELKNRDRIRKILLITPVLPEFHAAREIFGATELPWQDKSRLAETIWKTKQIRILQSGMGKASQNPYRAQLEEFRPDLIIDSGSCGALRVDMTPGTILCIEKVINESGCTYESSLKPQNHPLPEDCIRSLMLEVAEPVVTAEGRAALQAEYKADACSMESFLIARGADEFSVDWIGLRIVTDLSNQQTRADFKKNIRKFSLELYGKIKQMLESEG